MQYDLSPQAGRGCGERALMCLQSLNRFAVGKLQRVRKYQTAPPSGCSGGTSVATDVGLCVGG
jgi:hypothetical protein